MSLSNSIKFYKWHEYSKSLSSKILTLAISADLVLILLHSIYYLPETSLLRLLASEIVVHPEALLITEDQGFAEVFQYIKEFWIALILLFGFWQRKNFLFMAWGLFFGYLLLDDSLGIHEKLGFRISEWFNFQPAFNLRALDFGEVIVSFAVCIFFLIVISWNYNRSKSKDRQYSNVLLFSLFALAIPGVVFDLVQIALVDDSFLSLVFEVLEDGGEHIVMSIILAFVYAIDWETLKMQI